MKIEDLMLFFVELIYGLPTFQKALGNLFPSINSLPYLDFRNSGIVTGGSLVFSDLGCFLADVSN